MSGKDNNNHNVDIFDFADTPAPTASTAGNYNNAASNFTPVNIDASAFNSNDLGNNNNNNNGYNNNNNNTEDNRTYKGAHPVVAGLHIIFKIGALLTFILGRIFSSNYILIFVITVLFCAADFWTTKNITGRILVALRWWNQIKDDGTSEWVFESAPEGDDRVNAYDNWFFWVVLIGYTVVWVILAIFTLLSTYIPLSLIGAILAGSNLLGYIKCRRDARGQVTNFMMKKAMENPQAVSSAATSMFASSQKK